MEGERVLHQVNQWTPKHPWIGLVLFLVVCFAAAGIGGAVTTPKIGTWYRRLNQANC